MASENKHSINEIRTTIRCGRRDLAALQQAGLASHITAALEELVPLLDDRFGEGTVRLERLKIDVALKPDQLERLGDVFKTAFAKAIETLQKETIDTIKNSFEKARHYDAETVFLYFLEHGQLPWFTAVLDYDTLDFSKNAFCSELASTLKKSRRARERLVEQLGMTRLKAVLPLLYPGRPVQELLQFADLVQQNARKYSERYAAGFRLEQLLMRLGMEDFQRSAMQNDFHQVLVRLWPSFVAEVERECNGKHLDFLELLKRKAKLTLPDKPATIVATDVAYFQQPAKEEILENIWNPPEPANQTMVPKAGLVLLHPFLERFFKNIGLLENGLFISEQHQQRGICLLHHLATGALEFPEEELLLAKYLCNYPAEFPVPRELPISDYELEEAEKVLASALGHWTALKGTSIAGLRVNFLQRKGLLQQDEMGMTLHLEKHAADVLLDRLPWGLSAVRWSWLPTLLTIKWR